MKTFLILLLSLVLASNAVAKPKAQHFYWIVETNVNDKSYSIVRFYNPEDQLVHEELVKNYYIDLNRSKDKRRLNRSLRKFVKVNEKPDLEWKREQIVATLFD